jgi:hypothetical protein
MDYNQQAYNQQAYAAPPSNQSIQHTETKTEMPLWIKVVIGAIIVGVICLATGVIELPSSTATGTAGGKDTGSKSSGASGSSGTAPLVPKIYKLAPMYYSENYGSGVTAFGGKAGQPYSYNNVCPSGTKVITDLTNQYGPKVGYYAHSLNKKTPNGNPYPSSCASSMQTGADSLPLTSDKLKSFVTIGDDGNVVFNNGNLNTIWGDKCGGYFKTIELDLNCAENGVDPGAGAQVVSYPATAGFSNRYISRW